MPLHRPTKRGKPKKPKAKPKPQVETQPDQELKAPVKPEGERRKKRATANPPARRHPAREPRRRRCPPAVEPRLRRCASRAVDRLGRSQLRDPQVPGAGVPAADLPGRGHPVRRPLGGPGRDQRDRDRLRPQPQRLLRRRAGLDAVHAPHVAPVRHRRQQGRQEGPLQPRRRHLRRRPLPQGRRLREGRPPLDLRLQPRRLVRGLGHAPRPPDRRACRPTWWDR